MDKSSLQPRGSLRTRKTALHQIDSNKPANAIGLRLGPGAGDHRAGDQVSVDQDGATRDNPEIAGSSPRAALTGLGHHPLL